MTDLEKLWFPGWQMDKRIIFWTEHKLILCYEVGNIDKCYMVGTLNKCEISCKLNFFKEVRQWNKATLEFQCIFFNGVSILP